MLNIDDLLRRAKARAAAVPRPESTYRLQFHAGFTFRGAAAIVPYLADLGVTHCYASPYLRARPGTTHGYDVIDHCRLNPEVGTEADFEAWLGAMKAHGLSHILDTVPNHVGVATNENKWWNDVLANGPASPYAHYFDIAWRGSPRPELHDKVLLPVLGGPYAQVLEKGELKLAADDGGVAVRYYDRRFPISPATYGLIAESGSIPTPDAVARLNGTPGDARSFDRLDDLLNQQSYRLAYWRVAADEINYRRFFDINDLAALGMEHLDVFEATHALIFHLLGEGKLAGLRIDHPDGLFDPKQYFQRLQRYYLVACAKAEFDANAKGSGADWETTKAELLRRLDTEEAPAGRWPLYVSAEKILAPGEPLPADWPLDGTSGYDFLNMASGLFVDGANAAAFTRLYHDRTGDPTPFADLVYQKKRLILDIALSSELQMLTHQLDRLAQRDRGSRDFTHNALRHALRETIALFPVYRAYVSEEGVHAEDCGYTETAIERAIARNPKTDPSVFHFLRGVLLLNSPDTFTDADKAAQRRFAGKFQQVTAPVTAKGVEDTAFYLYNRLVSLNEVGGEPGHFGVPPADLHAYLKDRQAKWPNALSALSTHDTKRSEDVRARINVLSELPDEWGTRVAKWAELNALHRTAVGGSAAPDANEEYLLYQTIIGAWPLAMSGEDDRKSFVERIQAYMAKAMKEAKVHTSWTDPDAAYDAAVQQFVSRILDEKTAGTFLDDFRPFQKRVSHYGLLNSLSQTLLRLTAPGVPDTYQGTELWDFSLVDPDNRRPVDYARRAGLLRELRARVETAGADLAPLARELAGAKEDGRVKLFVTWRALTCRRDHPGLFSAGDYLPAGASGTRAESVFAFARVHAGRRAVVAVPRLLTGWVGEGALPVGAAWEDTQIVLPAALGAARLRNVFTGEILDTPPGPRPALAAAGVFAHFPVALFVSEE